MIKGAFKELHIVAKAMIFLGLLLIGFGLSSVLALLLANPLFGMDLLNNPTALADFQDPAMAGVQRFVQFMNSLGIFFFPPLFFAYLVSDNWKKYLSVDYVPQAIFFGLTLLSVIFLLPWINLMVVLNEGLQLPSFLEPIESWMRSKEMAAQELTETFLSMPDFSTYLINLVIMAVIPAIGEEILFRGILQQQLTYRFNNHHIGVWLAAILFSAIHLQFFGFFPRMFLGAFFGYLLVWTKSLWVPVLAHFINNAGAVSMQYFFGPETTAEEIDTIGTTPGDWFYLVISGLVFILLLRFTWQIRVREQ